ncbi:MAG TPA: heavy-metal-associated domain-containing protein [Burkholderiaceae bacterium]|nr:heavy-metal-associated domain-containing protein [Burkholderiaceae bacterium]
MQTFTVENMTCQHCVNRVTKAVHDISPQAKVKVDLDTKTVNVNSNTNAELIAKAISDAGYPAQARA